VGGHQGVSTWSPPARAAGARRRGDYTRGDDGLISTQMNSKTRWWVGLAATAVLSACTDPPPMTFADVRPVLRARCLRCHGGGDTVAHVSFATREEAARAGQASIKAMRAKKMPPHGGISEAEIRLVERWVALGMPE